MTSTLWYVRSDSLGVDETIGKRLVQFFWNNLSEKLDDPATFAFMNRGVFLTLDDSPVLATLRALESQGSRFLSCGTRTLYGRRGRFAGHPPAGLGCSRLRTCPAP